MALLLEACKEESARIRVENIILSDITTELLEILELYCELLLARASLLDAAAPPDWVQKEKGVNYCDPGLEEAVNSIIYAAPRTDVKELQMVRNLLVDKFGKEFALRAMENRDDRVAKRVVDKLRVEPPRQELVTLYLKEIARTYGVAWPKVDEETERQMGQLEDEDQGDNDDDNESSSGGQKVQRADLEAPLEADELSKATPPRNIGPKSPFRVAPPSPSVENPNPKINLPGPPELKPSQKMTAAAKKQEQEVKPAARKDVVGGKIPDVDELSKRFAALKR